MSSGSTVSMPGYLAEWYQPTMTHERLEQAAY